MAHIFVLALAAAVYPVLLAGAIVILAQPNPLGQLAAFLAGGMLMSVSAGLVLVFALQNSSALTSSSKPASWGVDVAMGAASLAVAAFIWAKPRNRRLAELHMPHRKAAPAPAAAPKTPRWKSALEDGSLRLAFAAGVVLNAPGPWYLAALKDIITGKYGTGTDIALIVGFNLIMFALIEVPLVTYLISPERASDYVGRFNAWLGSHHREIAISATLVVGVYLVVKGIAEAT